MARMVGMSKKAGTSRPFHCGLIVRALTAKSLRCIYLISHMKHSPRRRTRTFAGKSNFMPVKQNSVLFRPYHMWYSYP